MLLNICIDIDGTITEPYYWLKSANDYFNTCITEEQVTEYEIHKVLNVPREEYLKFYEENAEKIHLNSHPRVLAQQVISNLDMCHNIFYVTAREEKLRNITLQWFELNKIPKRKLYMLGSHDKVEKARELNCHIFIEDRYENALQLSQAGFKVLLIDTEYNRFDLTEGIVRVYSWNEIYTEIIKYQVEQYIFAQRICIENISFN